MTSRKNRRREVSEKSLELNVCAELLQLIRSWPRCQGALWFGLTQRQEREYGIDEMIRNVGQGYALMLQFKSPWVTSQVDDLYKFSVNEQQHKALEELACKHPNDVLYIFPLYSTWTKAQGHAPDLCQDTWVLPVSSISTAELKTEHSSTGRHRVELERVQNQVNVTFHSPEVTGSAQNAKEFFGDTDRAESFIAASGGVPSGRLLEWVRKWGLVDGDASLKWPRFRGLNAVYVPVTQP